jgi:hypothetical protein
MILNITKEDDEAMVSCLEFNKDKLVGEIGESLGKQYVEQLGYTFISGPPQSIQKEYDLLCSYGEKIKTVECKVDTRCKPPTEYYCKITKRTHILEPDTGNIFIEFESRGKQSGIITTKSDIWFYAFYYLKEIWTIPTPKLRKLIKENNFGVGRGGDKNTSLGYLIPKNKFIEHFNKTEFQLNII